MRLYLVFPLPFSSQVPQKERRTAPLSIAARHSGVSARLAPGGLEAAPSQRWRGFEPPVAQEHQLSPQALWMSLGKGPHRLS